MIFVAYYRKGFLSQIWSPFTNMHQPHLHRVIYSISIPYIFSLLFHQYPLHIYIYVMDYNGIYVFRIPSPSSPRSSTPAYGVNGCLTLVEEANGRQDLFMVDPGEWTVDSCVFMDSKRIRHQSCPKAVKKYPLHIMESQGLTKMRFSSKKTDRIGWCFFLRGKPLHLLINTMVNGCQFPLDFALHQSIEIWFNGVSWVEHSPL
jgi:hypothetical protein